jgi:hypothetical protein
MQTLESGGRHRLSDGSRAVQAPRDPCGAMRDGVVSTGTNLSSHQEH